MKQIKKLNKEELIPLIHFFIEKKENPELLKDLIGKEKDNNQYGSYILSPHNDLFKKVIISFQGAGGSSITLFGQFNLFFEDLVELLGDYRKVYVPYDDHYEFFFNENCAKGQFRVRIFFDNPIPESLQNKNISNIKVMFS